MKLKISRNKLSAALQKISGVISTRVTLPIHGNVLMEAEEKKLKLTGTDLDVRVSVEAEAEVEVPGITTLPARTFLSVVKSFSGDEVSLESDENHHMTMQCRQSRIKLLGLPPDDYPLPQEMTPSRRFKLPQAELGRMINMISYAVNQEDTRKALNGIFFSVNDNNLTTVATDGRRLALMEKIVEEFTGGDGGSILPVKSAGELHKLLEKDGPAEVEIGDNMARFTLGGTTTMTTKLIDENYPNYRQVIPASFSRKIEIPREDLVGILRRMSLVISERSFYVQLKFAENRLDFRAVSSDVGEGSDSMPIDYADTEIVISFNPIFMIEPLERLSCDRVVVKMNDGFSPVALSDNDGFLYVIMPLRKIAPPTP